MKKLSITNINSSLSSYLTFYNIPYKAFKLIGEKKYVKYARHIIDVTLKAMHKGRKKIRYREYKGKSKPKSLTTTNHLILDAFYLKSQIEK